MTSVEVLDALDDVTAALGRLVTALTEERRLSAVRERASAPTPATVAPEWMSVADVVRYAPRGSGERTIRAALGDRSLRGYQDGPGHAWAIRRSDVDAWLASRGVDGGAWD